MSIILDGTSGITAPTLDLTSGQLSVADGGTGTATGENLWRNRIINGGMNVWQRGTSFTLTASTSTYTTDRFVAYQTNTSTTVSQSTDVPIGQGFKYSIKTQRPASNTGTAGQYVGQVLESNNMLDLAGQSVTLTFWAKAGANYSATGSALIVQAFSGTVADQGSSSFYAGTWTGSSTFISTSQAITTTWTKYTFTGTVSSSALELAFYISAFATGTAGADDSFYITGVQLEKGSTATSFEYRPYGTELALCQRYYVNSLTGVGSAANTVAGTINLNFPITMRATPTIAFSGVLTLTDTILNFTQSSLATGTYIGTAQGGTLNAIPNFTGLTAQRPMWVNVSTFNNPISANAEL